jgi:hypothetical protein
MPSPSVIIAAQRRTEIKKFLLENDWTPTTTSYDYTRAYQYAREALGIPRQDRAMQAVSKTARLMRGEYVRIHAGRPISKITITVEEYHQLLADANQNQQLQTEE